MPVKIIDPDYYDAINFYGSGFWKNSAVDTPARILVENGHEQTFAYRFDWDELREVNGVDLSRLVGAAHALEILFVMGTFDNFIIKSFLFGRAPLDQRSNYRVIFNLIGLNLPILAIQEKEPIMPCHYGKNGQTKEKSISFLIQLLIKE